ncbi:MAG: DUF1795 domain-containing protein [Proteobacteria bacterium]|nr:DUF1795 domain-containing protein [Pseudomonadota bacterium]
MFLKKKNPITGKNSEATVLNNRFQMKFPEDWEDQSIYRYQGPEKDGIQHNIFVNIENNVEDVDIEDYAKKNIHALEKSLQGYQELKRGPVSLDSGVRSFELVYQWCPVENRKVYQRVVYILINQTGYILTATFSKKTWKTFGPGVDKILKSFSVPDTR